MDGSSSAPGSIQVSLAVRASDHTVFAGGWSDGQYQYGATTISGQYAGYVAALINGAP